MAAVDDKLAQECAAAPHLDRASSDTAECGRQRLGGVPNLSWLAIVSGLVIGWRRAEQPLADGDVLWGARTGQRIASSLTLPHSDPYSWTVRGGAWVPNSWGWDVVLAGAYGAGGLAGIAVLGVMLCGALGLVCNHAARRFGASGVFTGLTLQVAGGLFAVYLYARAQIVDYMAVLVIPLLVSAAVSAAHGRRRAGAALVGLQILWMNLHTTAVLGPVLVLAAGIGHVASLPSGRRRPAALQVVVLTFVTTAACLATPYGLAPVTHAQDVRAASAGLITEWQPIGLQSTVQMLAVASLALGAGACWVAVRARHFDAVAVMVVLAVASIVAVRFAPMLAFTSVPPLAGAVAKLPVRTMFAGWAWGAGTAVLLIICVLGASHFASPGVQNYSAALVKRLPSECRLLNDYNVGGQVILERPDLLVAIDSRNDVYGRAREIESIRDLRDVVAGRSFIAANRVTCVLAPSSSALVLSLANDSGWESLGHDDSRTLLVRRGME